MEKVTEAIELKRELDALRPLDAETEGRIMQKFRLDWNYHSNNIEGNQLSYGETKALILYGITAQGKPLKDHTEVNGHDEAIKWIIEVVKEDRPLTEKFIRQLHEVILKEPYEVNAETPTGEPTRKKIQIGDYKKTPNHVKTLTGEIFYFASPEETPAKMNDLIDWFRSEKEKEDINPRFQAARFHYRFVRIHPFDDGNGRMARILMNFILMQSGYPPVIIPTEDKANYFSTLQQADTGNPDAFIEYIAENLCKSLELMIKGAKGESIEEPDDFEKELSLLEKQLKNKGTEISQPRSDEAIIELFDNSFKLLVTRFIEKAKVFKKFYFEIGFTLFVDGSGSYSKEVDQDFFDSVKETLNQRSANELMLQANFKDSRYDNIPDLFYRSSVKWKFDNTRYTVISSNSDFSVQKFYGDQLTNDDIQKLVRAEMKAHKDFIQQKIEEKKS